MTTLKETDQESDARAIVEILPHPSLSRPRQAPSKGGIGRQSLDRRGQGDRIVWRDKKCAFLIAQKLQYAWDRGRDAGQALAARFHQHIWHAIAIAVPGRAARQNKQIGLAIEPEHLILRTGSKPGDAIAYCEGSCQPLKGGELTAAPDMNEAPVKILVQSRKGPEQDIEAFFRNCTRDRKDLQRTLRVPSGAGRSLV